MTGEIEEVPTTGVVVLRPAPRSLDALGRNHTLEAALAELVDNSIDAGARHVLIRFVQAGASLVRVAIVDDGRGMNAGEIDVAMTVGGDRGYDEGEIGRFGLGLKAASFSQADSLTVLSRRAGASAVGRRWRLERARRDFSCEVVDEGFAATTLDREWQLPPAAAGTVVWWDSVRGFPAIADQAEADRFLNAAIRRIQTHLGMIYHRLLGRGDISIFVDVEDVEDGLGPRVEILPLDPFRYPRSGLPGWPKTLELSPGGEPAALICHVWPARSQLEEFRLDGEKLGRQGLYVYLNDRLIQCGGWNGLVQLDKQLNLARVALDVTGDIRSLLAVKPEKNGIEPGPVFSSEIVSASFDDGSTFSGYIETVRGYQKESNRRQASRKALIPPGSGFDPRVRKSIRAEIPMREETPIDIRWCPLPADEFFRVDREDSTLWLNKRYRNALNGGRPGSLNDIPMIKTLLYLILEDVFEGEFLGNRDKDNINLWQQLLLAAAEAESSNG